MVTKELLACSSSAMKQVCLPVWEVAFFMFVSGVLVGGFVPFTVREKRAEGFFLFLAYLY